MLAAELARPEWLSISVIISSCTVGLSLDLTCKSLTLFVLTKRFVRASFFIHISMPRVSYYSGHLNIHALLTEQSTAGLLGVSIYCLFEQLFL